MKNISNRKWLVLIPLGLVWLLFTALYSLFFVQKTDTTSLSYEIVKFVFLAISAFGVLFSALLSSLNSLEASQNIVDRTEFDRIENSFYYIRQWESSILREVRDKAREIDRQANELSPTQLIRTINTDPVLERSVITMFNFFEEIHLSRKSGRVNDAYLKESFVDIYVRVYGMFSPWIKKDVDETMQKNLEQLRKDWE